MQRKPFHIQVSDAEHNIACGRRMQAGTLKFIYKCISYAAPGTPRMVKGTQTCNSITLSWRSPKNSGNLTIEQYRVSYTSDKMGPEQSRALDSNAKKVRLSSLKVHTAYIVRIQAGNQIGFGGNVSLQLNTAARGNSQCYHGWTKYVCSVIYSSPTHLPASHSGMVAATLKPISATKLRVSVPSDGNKYVCTLAAGANVKMKFNISALTKMKNVPSLNPGTKYTLHCVGYNPNGTESCKEVNESATTMKRKTIMD